MTYLRLPTFHCLSFLAMVSGCAGVQYISAGRTAETRNDPAGAYDQYCRAAASDPGNSAAADGINRNRAAAAAYWERSGLAALDDERVEDAWRCFMRVLDIQPDHATAASMVRQLEQTQSLRVAIVREEYVRRGPVTLRAVQGTNIADAGEKSKPEAETQVAQVVETPKSESGEVLAARLSSGSKKPSAPMAVTAAEQQPIVHPLPAILDEPEPPAISIPSKYTVTKTFSRNDQRFPRRELAVDGIELYLRDTDENGKRVDVDIDLYKEGERVKKIRGLPVGRSQSFRGSSGHVWRLTVLSAHQKTHTVRIGFRGVGH